MMGMEPEQALDRLEKKCNERMDRYENLKDMKAVCHEDKNGNYVLTLSKTCKKTKPNKEFLINHPHISANISNTIEFITENPQANIAYIADNLLSQANDTLGKWENLPELKIDREMLLEHVTPRLLSKEWTENDEIASTPFLDLKIAYGVFLSETMEDPDSLPDELQNTNFLVRKETLDKYGISKRELHEAAISNMQKEKIRVATITEIFMESVTEEDRNDPGFRFFMEELKELKESQKRNPQYILTTERRIYGTNAIFQDNVLRDFAKACNSNLIIIPTSIHEWTLFPENRQQDYEPGRPFCPRTLLESIKACNAQLGDEEALRDSVYYYDRNALALDGTKDWQKLKPYLMG